MAGKRAATAGPGACGTLPPSGAVLPCRLLPPACAARCPTKRVPPCSRVLSRGCGRGGGDCMRRRTRDGYEHQVLLGVVPAAPQEGRQLALNLVIPLLGPGGPGGGEGGGAGGVEGVGWERVPAAGAGAGDRSAPERARRPVPAPGHEQRACAIAATAPRAGQTGRAAAASPGTPPHPQPPPPAHTPNLPFLLTTCRLRPPWTGRPSC